MKHMDNQENIEKKIVYKRCNFTFPVEIKLLIPDIDRASFTGFIKNMSKSGACIQFEDRYGRLDPVDLVGANMRMGFNVPKGKIVITSRIMWSRKETKKKFHITIGIEFENLEDWQSESIENLISYKKKDHNMMWNLLEQYENNNR